MQDGIFNGIGLNLVNLQNISLINIMIGISDSWDKPYDKKDLNHPEHGKIRKLSMTCQLTDGSEYEGGELEFDFRNYNPHMRDESKHRIQCKEILPKGSIIVFPSFVWHRVKPVTKGVRYSLVVWNLGYPFK
jgi:PKHD-type hydroxylase